MKTITKLRTVQNENISRSLEGCGSKEINIKEIKLFATIISTATRETIDTRKIKARFQGISPTVICGTRTSSNAVHMT